MIASDYWIPLHRGIVWRGWDHDNNVISGSKLGVNMYRNAASWVVSLVAYVLLWWVMHNWLVVGQFLWVLTFFYACQQVLLYDEPTAGLDPIASTVVEDLIRSVHTEGQVASEKPGQIASYVVVTHQHSTIRRAVDRLFA